MRGLTYEAVDSNGKVWVTASQSKRYVLDEIAWWSSRRGVALTIRVAK